MIRFTFAVLDVSKDSVRPMFSPHEPGRVCILRRLDRPPLGALRLPVGVNSNGLGPPQLLINAWRPLAGGRQGDFHGQNGCTKATTFPPRADTRAVLGRRQDSRILPSLHLS